MKAVSPKKKLGQHFLNDLNIAQKIADLLQHQNSDNILEIGPGMGVLTQFLIPKIKNLKLVEIDTESVTYLSRKYPELQKNTLNEDFLKMDLSKTFDGQTFGIIGNFPYNISSQIVFKALEYRQHLPFFCGMFQKEVAQKDLRKTRYQSLWHTLCFVSNLLPRPIPFQCFPHCVFSPTKSRFRGSLSQKKGRYDHRFR